MGTFGSATSLDALFRAAVANEGNSVILTLERPDFTLTGSAATENQRAASIAIDQLILAGQVPANSGLEQVLNIASGFNAAEQQLFLSQNIPEMQAQATRAVLLANPMFTNTVLLRQGSLRSRKAARRAREKKIEEKTAAARTVPGPKSAALAAAAGATSGIVTPTPLNLGSGHPGISAAEGAEWEAWVLGFDLQGDLDADGNSTGARFDSDGFNLGLGNQIDDDVFQTRVGVTGATSNGLELNASYFREDASGHDLDGIVGFATYRF